MLFAVARTVGWIAQWKEMIEDPHQKLGRPSPFREMGKAWMVLHEASLFAGDGNCSDNL